MKTMILTGLGTEQKFESLIKDRNPLEDIEYFLIFNHGQVRVPVTKEAAEIVVKEMYGSTEEDAPQIDERNDQVSDDEEMLADEDGVSSI